MMKTTSSNNNSCLKYKNLFKFITMPLITPAEILTLAFSAKEKISASSIRGVLIEVAEQHFLRPAFGNELFGEFLLGKHSDFVNSHLKISLAQYVRYSLIAELSIAMSENGSIVYGRQQMTDRGNIDTQSSQSNKTDEKKTVLLMYGDSTTDNKSVSNSSSSETTLRETSTQKDGRDTDTTTIDLMTTKQDAQEKQSTNERLTFKPATDAERRVIINRARFEANVLLDKAVRYVKNNPDAFPTYIPTIKTISGSVIF